MIAVDKDETIYYNNAPVDQPTMLKNFVDALQAGRLRPTSRLPEVHIRGDKDVRFEAVGRVVLACQQAGIQKVGFLTEPHMPWKPTAIEVIRHGNE